MQYMSYLVIIGVYAMLEIKFDEQIRTSLRNVANDVSGQLMHSLWQGLGRVVMVFGIVWAQPMETKIIALATTLMYGLFYWVFFDSVFASGILSKKPWFLGTSSRIDKLFPKWSYLPVWILKIVAFGFSVYWVIKIG